MYIKEFIADEAEEQNKTEQLFKYAISLAFSPSYVGRIQSVMKKEPIVKEIVGAKNMTAYQQGNVIYVNKPIFYSKNRNEQIGTLLHEFTHVLQTTGGLFSAGFPEMKKLTNDLYRTISKNLVKPLPVFLTGKNVKLLSEDKEEILAYIMSGEIDWSAVKPEAQKLCSYYIKKSGMFNTASKFWESRLPE